METSSIWKNIMSLANHVKRSFAGMLVIGDVHADYESFMAAHYYAETHNLFLMSLGDLVDRGSFPFETVFKMHESMKAGKAGFTIGNHDNKYHRFHNGARVSFSSDAK